MELFNFYKAIRIGNKKAKNIIPKLHNLYNSIPDTTGCIENNETCGGWCCLCQSPQVLYSEFLNLWADIIKNSSIEEIYDFIEKSLKNYVNSSITKGCVFFDRKTGLCKCHQKRPFNCRIYGITPKEDFHKRYLKMKEMYKGCIDAVIKDQCGLVSTINGKEVKKEDIDGWWKKLTEIEKEIGIKEEDITDNVGGSYRNPHEHVLLYILPRDVFEKFQQVRTLDDDKEKLILIDQYMLMVRKNGKKN